jgi:hypothetical protein
VLHEGRGRYQVGDETFEAEADEVVIIPSGLSHSFVNTGTGPLRRTAIQETPEHTTTFRDDADAAWSGRSRSPAPWPTDRSPTRSSSRPCWEPAADAAGG